MKIFGLGIPELLIILVVILLIFGPRNLPKLGSAIGRAVKGLRDGMGNANKTTQAAPAEGVVEDVVVEDVEQLDQAKPASAAAAAAATTGGATATATKTVKKRVVKKKVS